MKRLLLGVGNRLSRDDGVGPVVASRLMGVRGWQAFDCGTSIENACGIVARERPDLLVIVDAARMGLAPGEVRRVRIDGGDGLLTSTHALPFSFVWARLIEAAGEAVFIGIEPADVGFGERLSRTVAGSAVRLSRLLARGRLDGIPTLAQRERESYVPLGSGPTGSGISAQCRK